MFSRTILALAMGLSLTACDDFGPGDYIVYRIALQPPELSADCFAGGAVPVNEQDDSSSLFTSATYILYMGADDVPYLDTGAEVMAGSGEVDALSFAGENVDVNFSGDMNETEERTSVSISVDMTVDGELVEGVRTDDTTYNCNGPGCPDPAATQCTTVRPFQGGEVSDVDLKHEV